MKLLKNRALALIVCVILIAASVFLGSLDLSAEQTKVASYFTEASDGSGMGITYDLKAKVDQANNLLSVASRYLAQDDLLIVNLNEAIDAVESAQNAAEAYDANVALSIACDALDDEMEKMDVSERDREYLLDIKTELKARDQIIGHSDFNDLAADFNDMIRQFPTNLIAKLGGVEEIPLYE